MDTVKCEIHVRIGDRYVTHTLIQITNYVTQTLIQITNYVTHTLIHVSVGTVSIFFQITPHSLIYSTPSVHFYKTLKTF